MTRRHLTLVVGSVAAIAALDGCVRDVDLTDPKIKACPVDTTYIARKNAAGQVTDSVPMIVEWPAMGLCRKAA